MFKFRLFTASILICIAAVFAFTPIVWALTQKQQQAKGKCDASYMRCGDDCNNAWGPNSAKPNPGNLEFCTQTCDSIQQECYRKNGIPWTVKGGGKVPRPSPGGFASPTPTPKKMPTPPHGGNAPIAPTPTATPKKSPPQFKRKP